MSRKKDPFLKKVKCPNPACPDQDSSGTSNIIWWSRKQGRYMCNTCGKTFNEFANTLFWNKQHPPEFICEVLQLLAEGMSIRGISRVKRIKPETAIRWRREAAQHLDRLEDYLFNVCELEQVQVDEIFTFIKKTTAVKK